MQRFSQMSKDALEMEIERLNREKQKAKDQGLDTQLAILEQKINLARSYLIDSSTVQTSCWYQVEGKNIPFYVEYLNGVMAWGNWEHSGEKAAVPLALLEKPVSRRSVK